LVCGLAMGQWDVAAWAGGGLAAYTAAMVFLLVVLERHVRRIMRQRDEPTERLSLPVAAKTLAAIPLTQVLHLSAVFVATCTRRIVWRGISYTIRKAYDVQMDEDRPFVATGQGTDSSTSL